MNSAANIHPRELAAALEASCCQLIDVREPVEHAESHVPAARLVPLGQIAAEAQQWDKTKPVVVMCQSGKRGSQAAEKLRALGFAQVQNLEGGILAWKAAGLPCESAKGAGLPLMRQVQIVIGLGVLTGTVLSVTVDPRWVYLAMFFGAGMIFAGVSGFCGLAMLMAKMPWNRAANAGCTPTTCSR